MAIDLNVSSLWPLWPLHIFTLWAVGVEQGIVFVLHDSWAKWCCEVETPKSSAARRQVSYIREEHYDIGTQAINHSAVLVQERRLDVRLEHPCCMKSFASIYLSHVRSRSNLNKRIKDLCFSFDPRFWDPREWAGRKGLWCSRVLIVIEKQTYEGINIDKLVEGWSQGWQAQQKQQCYSRWECSCREARRDSHPGFNHKLCCIGHSCKRRMLRNYPFHATAATTIPIPNYQIPSQNQVGFHLQNCDLP